MQEPAHAADIQRALRQAVSSPHHRRRAGVVFLPFRDGSARRRIGLAYRNTFPRVTALRALADVVRTSLPDAVRPMAEF